MCRRFFDFGGISLIFCGYKRREVITRERFAMPRVRYVMTTYIMVNMLTQAGTYLYMLRFGDAHAHQCDVAPQSYVMSFSLL